MEKTGLKHIEEESDKNLARMSFEGSEDASRELVKRYGERIKNHIQTLVPDTRDAEDISQEVFAKAFQMIGSYDSKYAFSTWIYTIARNSSIDFIRKRKINAKSFEDLMGGEESNSAYRLVPSPEEHLIFEQEIEKIKNAIDSLPEQYRVVAEMRFIHEYAYEEMARELGLPLGTIKTRIKRAKERLHKDGKLNIQLLP
jgi:RNA polymerase sigma-70 factor (ECF subfamily)